MSLSAILASEPIYAFKYPPEEWVLLRARSKDLRFPCCNAGVILKRSPLGTQFFAHARRGNCTTAPETAEHLQAKDMIARAAIAAGWAAETEFRGRTPTGEHWIADVLVTRGTVRLAFEVQWSRQSLEETQARHARYETSGVRALWLMRQRDIPLPSKALPAFLMQENDGEILVAVDWDPLIQRAKQRIPLDLFVQSALGRRLIWRPLTGKTASLAWRVRRRTCEVCSAWNQIPIVGNLRGAVSIDLKRLLGKPKFLIDVVLPAGIRRSHQIAKLDFAGEIVYESCWRCGASLMDQRYLYGKVIDLPAFSITLTIEILDALDDKYAFDYWQITEKGETKPDRNSV